MRLRPSALCAGAGAVGRLTLVAALCLIWLVGAPPASWALLGPPQTAEPAAVPAPGSSLLVGVDSTPDYSTQVPPPIAISTFPWGGGLARIGLMSDYTRPSAEGRWKAAPGVTVAPTAHGLLLNLGPRTTLRAGLSQQQEERDRALGERTQEGKLEFATAFGAEGRSGLRLAMTSVETVRGHESSGRRRAEAHLNLAPTARLTIGADYVVKSSDRGESAATQTVHAAVHLAPEAELSASLERVDTSRASATSESRLALSAALGCGKLKGEEKWSRTRGGRVASRLWAFSGGFGQGSARTDVKLDLRESRGERPEDQSTRKAFARVRRAVGPHLTLSAEYRENIGGTRASPERQTEVEYGIEARLVPGTTLGATLATGRKATGAALGRRRLGLAHQWKAIRLELEERSWRAGAVERSLLTWSAEAPAGELPGWAKTIRTGHQFPDAKEYLLGGRHSWRPVEMPFAGSRVWGARRASADEDGASSLGFAHRRVVAGRLDLQIAVEEHPEAEGRRAEWLPLPVRRSAVGIGGRVSRSLNARCGYGVESDLDSSGDRLRQMGLAVWGVLADDEEVEGAVSQESGRWEGERRSRRQVSLLYSHRVDEEHRVEVKLGYVWGEGADSGRDRDCRLTLGYEKPI